MAILLFSVPPSVEIGPTGVIEGKQYIIGEEGNELSIDCRSTSGSLPQTVTLYMDDVIVPTIALSSRHQQYKIKLENRHHLTTAICFGGNDAGVTEVQHKVYVTSKYVEKIVQYLFKPF